MPFGTVVPANAVFIVMAFGWRRIIDAVFAFRIAGCPLAAIVDALLARAGVTHLADPRIRGRDDA